MANFLDVYFSRTEKVHPACDEYRDRLLSAKSRTEVFDIMLESPCLEYMCETYAMGLGPLKKEMYPNFGGMINGRYRHDGTYSSVLFYGYKGAILCDTTVICLIDCNADITVRGMSHNIIMVSGESEIRLKGDGSPIILVYGDKVTIDGNGKEKTKNAMKN